MKSAWLIGGAALALCVHDPADGRCAPVDASAAGCGCAAGGGARGGARGVDERDHGGAAGRRALRRRRARGGGALAVLVQGAGGELASVTK